MPYAYRRPRPQQEYYNQQLHTAYSSTRRVAPSGSAPAPPSDKFADLKELDRLRQSGVLSDAEFTAAKTRILDAGSDTT